MKMDQQDTHNPSFSDTRDLQNASRGFIAKLDPCIVTDKDGREIWNNSAYDFLSQQECPPTAHPNLWRHSHLTAAQGLFEVAQGVYQVRGFDLSNMTVIEGHKGAIVVDPLISMECAAAALKLYMTHRGERPVSAVIYSHSHSDHFGGAQGVLPVPHDDSIPIIAPAGFMEEAMSENVFCGPAMRRRARYMYGTALKKGPEGQLSCGIGSTVSTGMTSLVPPNKIVKETGEVLTVDGVKIEFQMVPGTEAPAEINFYLPQQRALYISECATHSLHNIVTLRGAVVRDAKAWSKYLDETLALYGSRSDVLFAGHHWPTWGRDDIEALVSEQRDLYAFLHDQTIRMMNLGFNGTEIAEQIVLPPRLQSSWHCRGFYGSVSHNVKGIYQRYMTWFDGNAANLWPHTPTEEGKRYVECFGGIDATIAQAQKFMTAGDLRFAATLLDHAVKADPSNGAARGSLAAVYERLGFGCENSTWRNFYLTAAADLITAPPPGVATAVPGSKWPPFVLNPLGTVEQWLDGLSIQIDGDAAGQREDPLSFVVRDADRRLAWRVTLNNGALTYRRLLQSERGDVESGKMATVSGSKMEIREVLTGNVELARQRSTGDLAGLFEVLDLCGITRRGG